ncbi:hypothetical protein R1A28_21160 [Methylorubrum populi]
MAGKGRGKSGGYRIISYYAAADVPVFLLALVSKGQRADISVRLSGTFSVPSSGPSRRRIDKAWPAGFARAAPRHGNEETSQVGRQGHDEFRSASDPGRSRSCRHRTRRGGA